MTRTAIICAMADPTAITSVPTKIATTPRLATTRAHAHKIVAIRDATFDLHRRAISFKCPARHPTNTLSTDLINNTTDAMRNTIRALPYSDWFPP